MNIGFVDWSWCWVWQVEQADIENHFLDLCFFNRVVRFINENLHYCRVSRCSQQDDFAPKETVEGLVLRPGSRLPNLPLQLPVIISNSHIIEKCACALESSRETERGTKKSKPDGYRSNTSNHAYSVTLLVDDPKECLLSLWMCALIVYFVWNILITSSNFIYWANFPC